MGGGRGSTGGLQKCYWLRANPASLLGERPQPDDSCPKLMLKGG